uniref:Hydroxysteroid 17-beta dehydrogenase 1 n=1 Tax=Oryctolagus cuniculus TaxID=9986 RepID=G1TTN3_RABIT
MDRTVVLITGCSSGIGLHLAVRLASDPSQSFKVYATLRDLGAQGPLLEAARARGCQPGSLETLQLDVRDSDSVAAARTRVTEGRVDVLVCNAGRGLLGPLEAHSADTVASVLDVNVVGLVRTLQAFLPDMKRRGSGRVLVTGSVGGLMGLPFNDVYCASKFAIRRFMREAWPILAATLRGTLKHHRVWSGAHGLPGEAGGRPRRGPGPRGRPDASALLPLRAPLRAGLPRDGAGPRGGDGGLPHRAARPGALPALLQHRALPAPDAAAPGRPQRLQLRRRHAPSGVRRRERRGRPRRPWGPRARRASRRPVIKAWSAVRSRALLGSQSCGPVGGARWRLPGSR